MAGIAELIVSVPGAPPLTATKELHGATGQLVFQVDTRRLEQLYQKALSDPQLRPLTEDAAATVTVYLSLYTSSGRHLLATATVGSYDLALAKTGSPREASRLVRKDPLLVLHVGTLRIPRDRFTLVEVGELYNRIAHEVYNLTARPPAPGASPAAPAGLPSVCTAVTLDNYQRYGLRLAPSDFIVNKELYESSPPRSFYTHLEATLLPSNVKTRIYREFARRYSTAVYVPAACPAGMAVMNAIKQWYDPMSGDRRALPLAGLIPLNEFWWHMAYAAGLKNRYYYVNWRDVTRGTEILSPAPIIMLSGTCRNGCNDKLAVYVTMVHIDIEYHKNGLSIANLVVYPTDEYVAQTESQTAIMTPEMFNNGYVAFITANVVYGSSGDGIYIDFLVDRVEISDNRGLRYTFWRIVPITTFVPLQVFKIVPNTLSLFKTRYGTLVYRNLYATYSKLMGVTRPSYKWITFTGTIWNDVTLDSTQIIKKKTNAAGAVIGLSQLLLKQLVLSLVTPNQFAIFLRIASMLFSYAYTSWGLDVRLIKLGAQPLGEPLAARITILKTTTYSSQHVIGYFAGRDGARAEPLFMSYYVIYGGG